VKSEVGRGTTFTFFFECEEKPQNVLIHGEESFNMDHSDRQEETKYMQYNIMDFQPKKRPTLQIFQQAPLFLQNDRRIMVVDDEVFNTVAIQGLMRVLGFTQMNLVDICYNGEQAVELIQKAIHEGAPQRYSLILTDCSMPFMDGYEASKKIRDLLQQCLRQQQPIDSE